MNIKKVFVVMLVLVMIFSMLLVGCGKKEKEGSGDVSSGETVTNDSDGKDTGDSGNMIGNMYKTGLPIVKDKITVKIFAIQHPAAPADWNEYPIIKELEEKTNIHVEWELTPTSGARERLSLMFSTGELPDAVMPRGLLGMDDYKYGTQGLLIPLNDLIEKWAPNLKAVFEKYPIYKVAATAPDGNIYSIGGYHPGNGEMRQAGYGLVINKTWLNNLGLKEPETTEEFYQVLKAFKENDPNGNGKKDEIPFSGVGSAGHIDWLFGSFGVLEDSTNHIFITEDDQVIYSPTTEEYKEAIKWLRRLYTEGLIDQEYFVQDTKQLQAKGQAEEMIIGSYVAWHRSEVVGTKRAIEDYINILPLKGPNGHRMWNNYDIIGGYEPGMFAITSACKNPEIMMRWVDMFYEPEFGFRVVRAPEYTMEKQPDGKYIKKQPPEGMSEADFFLKNAPCWFAPYYYDPDIFANVVQNQNVQIKQQQAKEYMPYVWKKALPSQFYVTEEKQKRLIELRPEINSYIDQMKARWITGEGDVEKEWDDFQKKLKDMGVDELIEIYREVYEEFSSKLKELSK